MPSLQLRQRHQTRPVRKQRLQPECAPLKLTQLIRIQASQGTGRFFEHPAQLKL